MENFIRITGIKCPSCEGKIIETYGMKYPEFTTSTPIGVHQPGKLKSLGFSCENCGILFIPTQNNGLTYASKEQWDRIHNFLKNYLEQHLERDVQLNECFVWGEDARCVNFPIKNGTLLYMQRSSERWRKVVSMDNQFLIPSKSHSFATVIDHYRDNWIQRGKKRVLEGKLPNEIPKDAILGIDLYYPHPKKDLDFIHILVPENALPKPVMK